MDVVNTGSTFADLSLESQIGVLFRKLDKVQEMLETLTADLSPVLKMARAMANGDGPSPFAMLAAMRK